MGKLFVDLLLSSLGFGYFLYGKRLEEFSFILCGIALMFYPYLISNMLLKILIGISLLASPFIVKKYL